MHYWLTTYGKHNMETLKIDGNQPVTIQAVNVYIQNNDELLKRIELLEQLVKHGVPAYDAYPTDEIPYNTTEKKEEPVEPEKEEEPEPVNEEPSETPASTNPLMARLRKG